MVSRGAVVCCALALVLLLLFAGTAWATGGVTVNQYDVQETQTITVDALGDAHYSDVLKYDPAFFSNAGVDFTQYPALLSRRFEQQAAVKELQNFKSQFERATSTVTLTFDKPGKAYNMGSYWMLLGFTQPPTKQSPDDQVFELESTENSEFTLWQDLKFKTTTHLKLPAGASNVRYDPTQKAMLWDLAYAPPVTPKNLLQKNKLPFTVVFSLLIAASLVVATVSLVRNRPVLAYATVATRVPLEQPSAPPLPASEAALLLTPAEPLAVEAPVAEAPSETVPVVESPPVAETPPETVPVVEVPVVEASVAETASVVEASVVEAPPAPQPPHPRFCVHCGASFAGEERFCPTCGKAID